MSRPPLQHAVSREQSATDVQRTATFHVKLLPGLACDPPAQHPSAFIFINIQPQPRCMNQASRVRGGVLAITWLHSLVRNCRGEDGGARAGPAVSVVNSRWRALCSAGLPRTPGLPTT